MIIAHEPMWQTQGIVVILIFTLIKVPSLHWNVLLSPGPKKNSAVCAFAMYSGPGNSDIIFFFSVSSTISKTP